MKKTKQLRAFSLMELSIVILIIGILVAGITQGSRLVSQMKLTSARTQTQSSPVASIRNLVLWIESTSEKSFLESDLLAAETNTLHDDIGTWRDINPQTTSPAHFTYFNDNANRKPAYTTNTINGLPTVKFDGTNDLMTAPGFQNITSDASVFFVIRTLPNPDLSMYEILLSKRASSTAANIEVGYTRSAGDERGWTYGDGSSTTAGVRYATGRTIGIPDNTNYIVSIIYTAGTNVKFYENGGLPANRGGNTIAAGTNYTTTSDATITKDNSGGAISTPNLTNSNPINLGKNADMGGYFAGHVGEIIIFDRALKAEERMAVEGYLSKKWAIPVVQTTAY